ncbi:MAG: tryptophan--tRNA ligase, partial [Ottowia sp.]|nr:tryptophan--tRNA ligase [Ottowia sp.]MCB2069427.1 tryptophan--tRNA ligase [Ottowia sp.]
GAATVLLQSKGFDSPRDAGQAVRRLQTEGATALAALKEWVTTPQGVSEASVKDALERLVSNSV